MAGGDIDLRGDALTGSTNQGLCNSGYAVAVVDCVNLVNIMIKKKVPILSWQHLVDCSNGYGINFGCYGGQLFPSFDYILMRGIHSERAYPIRSDQNGVEEECRYLPGSSPRYRIKSYSFFTEPPEESNCISRYRVLEKRRPVVVMIAADSFDFFMYS